MLRWRLISAAVVVGLILSFFHLDYHYPPGQASGLWTLPLFFAVAILGTGELLHLLTHAGWQPRKVPVYAGVLLIISASCIPMVWRLSGEVYPVDCGLGKLGWPLGACLMSLLLLFIAEMRNFEAGDCLKRIAAGCFVLTYLGLQLSFWVPLRLFHDHHWGMAALFSMLFVVKISDSGAYFVGRLLGRHKMAPRLSPGKTWEGAAGGIASGIAGSFLFFHFMLPLLVPGAEPAAWWAVAVYGIVLTLFGMIGDLVESLIKRDTAIKDSSSWLPGLGGVLDMIDSVLVAGPPAYLCWVSGLLGT